MGLRVLHRVSLALICNALDAFGATPDGWAWTAFRGTLSAAVLIAALGWVVAVVRERRRRPY